MNINITLCQEFCNIFPTCEFWSYNNILRHCQLYNKTVDVSTCDIIGGLTSEDPNEICENAQGCDVSTYIN